MALRDIFKRLTLPGESLTLQQKNVTTVRDETTGEFEKIWIDYHTLTGIIRGESTFRDKRGEEEIPALKAYFLPDFDIPIGDLGEYRIKHIRDNETYYRQILEIDRDLRLNKKRHHYKMLLGKNPRWEGDN